MDPPFQADLALARVFRLSRILGVFPFDHSFQVRRAVVLRSAWMLGLSAAVSTLSHFSLGYGRIHIRRTLKVLLANSTSLLSFFILLRRRQEMSGVWLGLRRAELALGGAWRWDGRLLGLYRSHLLYFTVLALNVGLRLRDHDFISNLSHLTTYILTFPFVITLIGQFTALQDVVCSMFEAVEQVKRPRQLVLAVDALRVVAESTQQLYGLQLLLYVVCIFSFVLCNSYFEFVSDTSFETSLIHILWLVTFVISVFDVIATCNRTATKARHLDGIIYEQMMNEQTNDFINDELLEFHMFCSKELEFTASGFFPLDNSLISSMIAAATTYLVILLQYFNKQPMEYACPAQTKNST